MSNPFPVPASVPQGGLLSPLLFVICLNSLDLYLPPSVIPVKYANDLSFCNGIFTWTHSEGLGFCSGMGTGIYIDNEWS